VIASWKIRVLAGMVLLANCPAVHAQDAEANATLAAPIQIQTTDDLVFGTVIVPLSGSCTYGVPPSGAPTVSGGSGCAFISGVQVPAGFEVRCGASVLTRYEVNFDDLAPTGTSFSSPALPMKIDGHDAGGALQLHPCDTDGLSLVSLGGVLTVSATASGGFSGRVGTIRLEVAYD
jgi:hypothetical protein